jgi:pimeloyl-ACP methyl ester carboxylesterase
MVNAPLPAQPRRTPPKGRARATARRSPLAVPPSSWVELDGPVHYLDYGGPAGGPLMVLVHGLGGSALNWAAVAPSLARRARVLALDLAGFGRTLSGSRSSSVQANQRLLHRFLTEVAGSPAILVGNSMGGLITVLQTHEHPETVAAAVLVDPALPVGPSAWPDPLVGMAFTAYVVPAVGRRLLSSSRRMRSADENAHAILRLCCADASRVPAEVVEHHLGLARERHADPDVDAELLTAARSLLWVLARRGRHAAMMREIRVPVLLLHGDKDRLVPVAAARAAAADNPGWRFAEAAGVGHVPQLEAPDWTLDQIWAWLDTDAAGAADLARDAAVG